jgi:hypothetical protein
MIIDGTGRELPHGTRHTACSLRTSGSPTVTPFVQSVFIQRTKHVEFDAYQQVTRGQGDYSEEVTNFALRVPRRSQSYAATPDDTLYTHDRRDCADPKPLRRQYITPSTC